MTPFRQLANWAKMTSYGGKLITLACHLPKKVNKAEELTYLSTNMFLFDHGCLQGLKEKWSLS
jgi:hypothetical protein